MHLVQLCIVTAVLWLQVAAECQKLSSCSCRAANGGVLDLSPLAASAGNPAFTVTGADSFIYQFNPCYGFACGPTAAADSAVCQYKQILPQTYTEFGTQNSAEFANTIDGQYQLQYRSADSSKQSVIKLICNPDATVASLITSGAQGSQIEMELTSRHACVSAGYSGASGGDILLIILFSLLAVYLIGGVLINKFVRGQAGLQLIPNWNFWRGVPGLIVEGGNFCFGSIKSRVSADTEKQESYSKI